MKPLHYLDKKPCKNTTDKFLPHLDHVKIINQAHIEHLQSQKQSVSININVIFIGVLIC
jgi:hypothetical protein